MSARIFVTGATGYLGERVARELLAAGHPLRLLCRPTSRRPELPGDVEWFEGDLLDPASMEEGLAGCRALVHTAGLVSNWEPDPSVFDRINVEALDALLAAAATAGIQRVVYTSSFFSLGPSPGPTPHDESGAAPTGWFTDYDRTKIAAAAVVERHVASGLDVVSVLPTVIYGPGARTQGNHVATILEDLLAGKLPGLLGSGEQMWNYAFVDDVARGHVLALEHGVAGGKYLLGGENRSLADFLHTASRIAERPPVTRKVPFWVLHTMARAASVWTAISRRRPELTRGMVRCYEQHWACDDSRARGELGYAGRPVEDGLRETIGWLRGNRS